VNSGSNRTSSLSSFVPLWIKRLLLRILPKAWLARLQGDTDQRLPVPGTVSCENPAAVSWRRFFGGRPHLHRLIVHVTDHCNLNCRGCTHFSNIAKPSFADLETFTRDFERMAGLFSHITEIFLLGGEPLLHPELTSFIEVARSAFPDANIEVMTNGILLPRMDDHFWQTMAENDILLDVDLYPIGPSANELQTLAQSHQVRIDLKEQRGEVFFRLPLDPSGSQDPRESFRSCVNAGITCPLLREGKLYPCAYAAYIDLFKERFNNEGFEISAEDYRDIYQMHNGWELFDFLLEPIPFCRYCDFGGKESIAWEQASPQAAQMTDWLTS
jgi:hypothetical protein